MKAQSYDRWGGPEALRLGELSLRPLAAGSVRIDLAWAGVNPADCKVMSGMYKLLCRGGFPRRIGLEGSGHIAAVGSGVAGLTSGMPVVFGLNPLDGRSGAWAEQADVPAQRVLPLPQGIALRDAAVLPIAALTAWLMCRITGVKPGQDVLVSGASGGVGHFAVQIARSLGARVTATGGERNRSFIEALGAEAFLDYRQTPPENSGRRWDSILDCVNSLRPFNARLLKAGGSYVDTDPRPLTMLGDRLHNVLASRKRHTVAVDIQNEGMQALFQLLASGQLKPAITREYPLARASDAARESLTGHVVGKLLLKIGG